MGRTAKHSVSPGVGNFTALSGQSGPSCKRWTLPASTARLIASKAWNRRWGSTGIGLASAK